MMAGRVAGKVAVVTGAARGIGRGCAEMLAREGARVAIGDVLEGEGAAVVAGIRDAGGDAVFQRRPEHRPYHPSATSHLTPRGHHDVDRRPQALHGIHARPPYRQLVGIIGCDDQQIDIAVRPRLAACP